MMYGHEKSDPAIVAVKPANKAEQRAERPGNRLRSWWSQGRGPRGMRTSKARAGHSSRGSVSQALERIRQVARERKKEKFTALFHHISIDQLEEAFSELKEDAAPGVDGLTWRDYEQTSSAISRTCMLASIGERIGHCRRGGFTYPSRMVGSARSRSPPWRTRSSRGRRLRC